MNHLLHAARTDCLRSMPRVSGPILSAGCSGIWYFDWITEAYEYTGRHIGIEFYSPKPEGLPSNVEWIANTVGDMRGVQDGEVELVFSGQNIEHLWPEDIAGFLLESWRVLKPGGWLVADSPNRLLTEAMTWSHPEHIIELTPGEMRRLADLAGFEDITVKGVMLCRDPKTGRLLPFDAAVEDAEWPMEMRLRQAPGDPDNSFVWWLEARRSRRPPRPGALKAEIDAIVSHAWPERSRRFQVMVGERFERPDGSFVRCVPPAGGAMIYGPYVPLRRGRYSVLFEVKAEAGFLTTGSILRCDIVGADGREILVRELTKSDLKACSGRVRLDFELQDLEFGVQARCISHGKAAVECRIPDGIVPADR